MLARLTKMKDEREGGFTLIELLVVIIIIGILAAIAIPTFLKQREKGYYSAMQSDLKNAATSAESFATENNGSYSALTLAALQSQGFNKGQTMTVAVVSSDASKFCLGIIDSRTTSKSYHYDSTVGTPVADTTAGTRNAWVAPPANAASSDAGSGSRVNVLGAPA